MARSAATRGCGIFDGSASSAKVGSLAPARPSHCAARLRVAASKTEIGALPLVEVCGEEVGGRDKPGQGEQRLFRSLKWVA
jgi:hypothetical protein